MFRLTFHSCKILYVSEEDYGVETCCVPVDFSSGRDTYNTIWETIKDKEIGVLGKARIFLSVDLQTLLL